jgi:hypothetical protein
LEKVERTNCSTLKLYNGLNLAPDSFPHYLADRSNVEGTKLMKKFRLGYLWLMTNVAKVCVPSPRDECECCGYGIQEDVN